MTSNNITYFTKELLIEINRGAIKQGRDRTLNPYELLELDDEDMFPVMSVVVHNVVEMRCRIIMNSEGGASYLDLSLAELETLPTETVVFGMDSQLIPHMPVIDVTGYEYLPPSPEDCFQCISCDLILDHFSECLYNCGSCGCTFIKEDSADGVSNRCPECKLFASKEADYACSDCELSETNPVTAFNCPTCNEYHLTVEEVNDCD